MNHWEEQNLTDEFPETPARRAVVSVVRGFGALARQMGPHYAKFGLTPPQFQMLTVLNRLRGEQITQRRLVGQRQVRRFPQHAEASTSLQSQHMVLFRELGAVQLGKELYVSFPNVTAMLSRLEKGGFVAREVNVADRRERFVRITSRGRRLLKKIWKSQPDQLERVTAGLTEGERNTLARLLNKMINGQRSPANDE